ncbi:RNA-binding protein 1-like isoform X2 [Macadamia integrifolia]|uniref:RNA-binding protein 1-like isoform X2 n=1 Tax=Macadamia integrifolia TaxID=60698 RepID=UPI001C4F25D0|nr:RNA-binding protein 1-like isoform X2 [Macadamia integrifolia]
MAMADGYWRYGDANQTCMLSLTGKRSRFDYEFPGTGSNEDVRGVPHVARDAVTIEASYNRYLCQTYGENYFQQMSSYGVGESSRTMIGGMTSHYVKSWNMDFVGEKPEMLVPPDASNSLYVEGLPADCTRREASHIFHPFVGFKDVRLVIRQSKFRYSAKEPYALCFVDFETPAQAMTALHALQGYKFDRHDENSAELKLQFARHPRLKLGGGPRGWR